MDREALERQYEERSWAEYDRQLAEILVGVERVLRSLPVRFQIKGRVKSFAESVRNSSCVSWLRSDQQHSVKPG